MNSEQKLEKITATVKEWLAHQDHDRCHYYPDIFRRIAEILEIKYREPSLPPEEEFRRGCERYRLEIYHEGKE